MNVFIKCKKRNLSSLTSRYFILLYCSKNSPSSNLKISALNSRSAYIKHKNISRRHWRSVHVILRSKKVNWPILKLFSLIEVVSYPLKSEGRVVIVVNVVRTLAKIANPSCSTISEPNKWIYISSTIFTSDYWIWSKWNRRHRLIILKGLIFLNLRSMGLQNNWHSKLLEFHIPSLVSLSKESWMVRNAYFLVVTHKQLSCELKSSNETESVSGFAWFTCYGCSST